MPLTAPAFRLLRCFCGSFRPATRNKSSNRLTLLLLLLVAVATTPVTQAASACDAVPLAPDASVNGSLEATDCLASEILGGTDESFVDIYAVTLTVAGQLTVTLNSDDLDAFGIVLEATGLARIADDDDSGGGLNARLVLTLEAGDYLVLANTATSVAETGSYVLTLSHQASTASRLSNISTRGPVRTGDEVMIGGLIISGSQPKDVLIRGIGPSLADAGVPDVLADPTLALFTDGNQVETNGTCSDHPRFTEIPTILIPPHTAEACIIASLAPGGHTAILSGTAGTGVGLVEIYELDTMARLVNISTRGYVGTGDNVMIGGLIIQGDADKTVVVRGIAPSLTSFGVTGVLADPRLALFSGSNQIHFNDNWADDAGAANLPDHLVPADALEAAFVVTLSPGAYTAILSGAGSGTGVALVEVYEID